MSGSGKIVRVWSAACVSKLLKTFTYYYTRELIEATIEMKTFSWNWFLLACIFNIFLSCFLIIDSTGFLWATEQNPFLLITTLEKESPKSFKLISAQVIDAQLLDDQMLEDLSPALIAPLPVIVSRNEYNQFIKQEYDNSICFKQCHSRNDFSVSDKTEKQWRLLIEDDGHAIFNIIPWEKPPSKEKILKYLLNNALNSGPKAEGIGIWH